MDPISADSHYTKSVMSTDIVVDYLGNVSWTMAAIFKSSCPFDVKHYPFDRQTCTLNFASWAYDGSKIDLVLNSEIGDQSYYMASNEWDLLRIRAEKNTIIYSCCPDAPAPFINIHISIERRPMFYVFNLILPCVLISSIALLGFYMPSDSGEKVTLGITSLLSTTVFLMLVAEGMPPTSEALPLIGIYYIVTIFLVSSATAMSVLTLNVHHQGVHGRPVPAFLQAIAFGFLARVLFVRIDPYHSITQHVRWVYQKKHSQQIQFLNHQCRHFRCSPERRIKQQHQQPAKPRVYSSSTDSSRSDTKISFSSPLEAETPLTSIPSMSHSPFRKPNEREADDFQYELLRVVNMVHAAIERNELRIAEKDRRTATELEWQQECCALAELMCQIIQRSTKM
ncbi:Neurotransmitter-gated ion-channel transmembrane region [Oesophagostomum dentatum]|uniref:Neurotransmitter-gated ion-channel transmembrane region n=1 Tax=Oesophagostomum dentatum TaxID=61180 RepID=A0A0B1T1A7_OESDE|nr:Neurotransmitter-gated ion-channel transmembrane region [Oesophagostomum dentatum]